MALATPESPVLATAVAEPTFAINSLLDIRVRSIELFIVNIS